MDSTMDERVAARVPRKMAGPKVGVPHWPAITTFVSACV
jgi:hypothetical protein